MTERKKLSHDEVREALSYWLRRKRKLRLVDVGNALFADVTVAPWETADVAQARYRIVHGIPIDAPKDPRGRKRKVRM